jgi:gas vesicle protein
MKIKNIKEEVTQDMENLRKKNQTETQNTMEGHSSTLEQAEDRISELEDKMEIKGETVSQTTQDLQKKYARTNLRRIQNGDSRAEADSVSSVNQKFC